MPKPEFYYSQLSVGDSFCLPWSGLGFHRIAAMKMLVDSYSHAVVLLVSFILRVFVCNAADPKLRVMDDRNGTEGFVQRGSIRPSLA